MTPAASTPSLEAGSRSSLSFRDTLVLGVCGLVLFTGMVVLALAHRSANQSTETLSGAVFQEVSNRAAVHTRAFVLRATPVVESLVQLSQHGLAIDDHERLAPQLLAVLRANAGLSWVSYGDETGTFTGAYRTPEGGLRINHSRVVNGKTKLVEHDVRADGSWQVLRTDDDSGYDPRQRPYYTKAKAERRLVWLPPYVFYNLGVPGISCAAPVNDAKGTLRGVLSVDFDLNALSDFVAEVKASDHSRVFLFTTDQVLLAYPDQHVRTNGASRGQGELLTLQKLDQPLIDAYRTPLPTFTGEQFHRYEFRHDGTTYLASATTFRVGDDLLWAVGVVAPKSDFIGDVWRTQAVALVAAILAVLIALALAFLLARTVSRPVGALIAFMRKVGAGDLDAKADFGGSREFRQLAEALNHMIADLRDRLRLRHSLGVAMEVQQRLLPASAPILQGLDVAGHSTYCDETGGDYYDFLVLDKTAPDVVLLALGDVMGHGVAAALVMAGVRAVLRDRAVAAGDLAELMGRLNRFISADHNGERFMTMHLSVMDAKTRTLRWISAGHDPVIVYDPATTTFSEVGDGDLPLGVVDEMEYTEQTSAPFTPGQILFIGTDGVWEMPNATGDQYGKDRLRDVIKAHALDTAANIATAVRASLTVFKGDAKSVDDVTFVVVKVLGDVGK